MFRKFYLIFFLSLIPTGQAWAHAHLQRSAPTANSLTAHVQDIRLTFSEAIEPKFSFITLSTTIEASIPISTAVDPNNSRILIAHLTQDLPAGTYNVVWSVVSVDTHHSSGTFTFTVLP